MSDKAKESLSRWMPLVISILSYVAIGAFTYGKLDQRMIPLESHLVSASTENQIKMFVTRTEWGQMNDSREREMAELKASIRNIDSKLDRLIEHEIKNKN